MDLNLADKMWDLANLVTGFAIAQSLGTTFALAKFELKALTGSVAHWVAFVFTLILTGFYIKAIFLCANMATEHSAFGSQIWQVTYVREGAIILFTLVMLFALLGHARFERDEARRKQKL